MKFHLIVLIVLYLTPFLGISQDDINQFIIQLRFDEAQKLAQEIVENSEPTSDQHQMALYQIGVCRLNLGELVAAKETFNHGLSIANTKMPEIHLKGLAMLQHEQLNYDSALYYYDEALKVSDKTGEFYFQLLIDKGELLMAKEEYKKASELFFKAKKLYDKNKIESLYLKNLIHSYIGRYYLIKNDYKNAEQNLKLALSIGTEIFNPDHPLMAEIHESLGLTYINLEDQEKMLYHYRQVYEINRKGKEEGSYDLIVANNIMGMSLLNAKDYDEASKYLILAYEDMANYFPKFDIGIHIVGMNLGITYYLLKDYSLAKKYLHEAVIAGRKANGLKAQTLGEALGYLALAYEDSNDFKTALKIYNEAIESNTLLKPGEILSQSTEVVDVETISFILQNRAQFYLKRYLNGEGLSFLDLAMNGAELNLKILQKHQESLAPESRSSLSYELNFGYYLAVDINWHLHQKNPEKRLLENILNNIERSKSDYLRVSLALAETKSAVNIPADLLTLDDELQIQKEELKAKIIAGENQGIDKLPWDSLVVTQQRMDSVREVLQVYVDDTYTYEWKSLNAIQNRLSADRAILDIMYREGILTQMIITKNEVIAKRDSVNLLNDYVLTFRNEIQSLAEEFSTIDVLNELLTSALDELPASIKKLTIIPDGALHYLPFDLLGDEDNYLLQKYDIQYANFLEDSKPINQNNNNLLSYAPNFGSDQIASLDVVRNDLAAIPGANEEVNAINRLFSGESIVSSMATETSFKEKAKDYGIIHMATHAIVDDRDPEVSRLVFNLSQDSLNDGYLHAYEIYNLDLNANLVTLSACNTGYGKIERGEGVMSLSWAFAYAGVPATVVSLWPASDKSTPELMTFFYQNLKDGQSKDAALNNARKQYLATAQGKARHPFYWGGFVLIGDDSPIEEDTNLLVWILLSAFSVLLIRAVINWKKK